MAPSREGLVPLTVYVKPETRQALKIAAAQHNTTVGQIMETAIANALKNANNGDVRAVQLHARHADPQTTMRYDDNRQDLAGRVAAGLATVL